MRSLSMRRSLALDSSSHSNWRFFFLHLLAARRPRSRRRLRLSSGLRFDRFLPLRRRGMTISSFPAGFGQSLSFYVYPYSACLLCRLGSGNGLLSDRSQSMLKQSRCYLILDSDGEGSHVLLSPRRYLVDLPSRSQI